MDIKVSPSPFIKELEVPTSKSYANRLLILAALFPEDFLLQKVNFCDDVVFLVQALRDIGLEIEVENSNLLLRGQFPQCEKINATTHLNLGDGGTTVRFLLPFLAKGRGAYLLKLGEQIRKRPLRGLIDTLVSLGVRCEWQNEDLFIQGPLKIPKSPFGVEADKTSQFASALALALAPEKVEVLAQNQNAAVSYFALTQELISKVQKGQRDFLLPVDFSSLAYPLALAAAHGKVLIANCFERDHFQGDSIIISILEKMGFTPAFTKNGLEVQKISHLKPFDQNCRNCQDLVPVLAFLASLVSEESCLSGLENLRHKETDRIQRITEVLDQFSIPWRYDDQSFSLYIWRGKSSASFVRWNSIPDHRIIMMVYLFMRCLQGGEILQAEPVSKSYPFFFDTINS